MAPKNSDSTAQSTPPNYQPKRSAHFILMRQKVLDGLRLGKNYVEIAKELNITRQRANQLLPRDEYKAICASEQQQRAK